MHSNGDLSGNDNLDPRRSLWGGVLATALLMLLLVGGAIVSVPLVATAGAWFGRHGCGHGHHGGGDPEVVRERAAFVAEWVLRRIDGTEAQREQVTATLEKLIDDVYPLAEQHRANRDGILAELSSPSVDRDAIQELRRAEMELVEVASIKLVDALADMAQTLTPEQRGELVELARHHHR